MSYYNSQSGNSSLLAPPFGRLQKGALGKPAYIRSPPNPVVSSEKRPKKGRRLQHHAQPARLRPGQHPKGEFHDSPTPGGSGGTPRGYPSQQATDQATRDREKDHWKSGQARFSAKLRYQKEQV